MNITDVINFHLNNPPFEVTDTSKYAELLNYVLKYSVHEMSENDPIIEERVFNSSDVQQAVDVPVGTPPPYILVDTALIDENFMSFIILHENNIQIPTLLSDINIYCAQNGFGALYSGSNPVQASYNAASLTGWLAYNDYFYIIQEWFETKIAKIIFQGTKIKLKPNTDYVALYKRYRQLHEVDNSILDKFRQLVGINLMLTIYSSDTFSAEAGIRSVSLSGLSVSFNVASADSKVASLNREKRDILGSIAMDYSYDGMIGII